MTNEGDMEMPPIQHAILEPATLERLFTDLGAMAEVTSVLVRNRPGTHARPQTPSLLLARESLVAGEASAVQLRYRLDGTTWCDTLMRTSDGIRLVRVQLPAGP